jgi:hypothetical protein
MANNLESNPLEGSLGKGVSMKTGHRFLYGDGSSSVAWSLLPWEC